MVHKTFILRKMASTHGGMRRILKRRPTPVEYIRSAVKAGVYKRPSTSPRDRYQNQNDPNAQLQKYPIEYEILSLNPPIPTPPRVTARDLKRDARGLRTKHKNTNDKGKTTSVPTVDGLVKNYMTRYDARKRASSILTEAEKEEYYYRRILGVPHHQSQDLGTAMGKKSAVLTHAYDFAIKQYGVLKSAKGEMSEKESVRIVEEMLAKEAKEERGKVRTMAREVKEWRRAKDAAQAQANADADTDAANTDAVAKVEAPKTTPPPPSTIPSILHSRPRTIQAMHIWGQRLAAVPYAQWTLGASTALDHWIAVDVLQMSEETWNSILRGELESDLEEMMGVAPTENEDGMIQVGNLARGRDIVQVRQSLFPETILSVALASQEEEEMEEDDFVGLGSEGDWMGSDGGEDTSALDSSSTEDDHDLDATERSIDELLASLGGFDEDEDDLDDNGGEDADADQSVKEDGAISNAAIIDDDDVDARVSHMIDTLQEWRAKHQDLPFQDWDMDAKKEFNQWLAEYVALVTNETDGEVDMNATRDTLLSEPPRTREDSESFWSRVVDETEAEILLQKLLQDGISTANGTATAADAKTQTALETFLNLPYDRQLRRLVNMGTLRPILDEYTKESDRVEFMKRYGEMLLEGMEIEHLVSDPDGPITLQDLEEIGADETLVNQNEVDKDARFSIRMIPYGTDEFGSSRSEKARSLYRAWSMHKAGRARYEEHLFKTGKIGLKEEK